MDAHSDTSIGEQAMEFRWGSGLKPGLGDNTFTLIRVHLA